MKRVALLFIVICLSSCTTVSDNYNYGFTPSNILQDDGQRTLSNIKHVYTGMTVQEIKSIMGDSLEIGYSRGNEGAGSYESIVIKNPYKEETIKDKGRHYLVLYYYTQIKEQDGKVSPQELTPLVFEGDRMIGKGYDFLASVKKDTR